FLGGFGRLYAVDVAKNGFDAIIPTMLQTSLSDLLIAVVVILVLSASMSTLSSLVIASSSTLTIDLLKDNIIKKMSDKKQVVLIRVFVVVFIAISALIAIYQTQSQNESVKFIAQLMGVSWGALAGAFLAPFLYGLYWKKTTKLACWVSFIFGAGIMLLNLFARNIFPAILQSPINCGAFAMLAGLIIVPVVSLISPKPDKKAVDEAFECYNKKVLVKQKDALEED
ncbi:MAG TPA: sodium:solute symporter, partial [Ruminococcaceae bacterium]|nr:sodium:solute symporter [Oscillospiraceae bacterium]